MGLWPHRREAPQPEVSDAGRCFSILRLPMLCGESLRLCLALGPETIPAHLSRLVEVHLAVGGVDPRGHQAPLALSGKREEPVVIRTLRHEIVIFADGLKVSESLAHPVDHVVKGHVLGGLDDDLVEGFRDGGNLGQLSMRDTAPEFDAALCAMIPGEITAEPVASRFGHHIIRLDRKIEGRQLPFERVRERIAAYLVDRARHMAIAQFVARLSARADITGVDLPTTADLRVS